MYIVLKINLTIIAIFLVTDISFSQKSVSSSKFSQLQLDAYKIDENIYNFFWYKYNWYYNTTFQKRNFIKGDTLPYFVDYKEYKGLVNYGIEFSNDDKTIHTIVENLFMYYLDVEIENFTFKPMDSTINIRGLVKGGWNSESITGWRNTNIGGSSIDIFVGQKRDTINKLYYDPNMIGMYVQSWNIKYKGKVITKPTVLDSFPSFYLDNYKHFKTNNGIVKSFEINAKIDQNSLLIFGLENCYSEVFEVGKMVFDSNTPKHQRLKESNRQKNKKIIDRYHVVIRNNVQELYKDTITKPKFSWYYQIITTAETYIVNNQYANAKNEYNKLLEKEHYIFARDMHNAVRTAILSRDYETAIIWCEKLALKGVTLKYFDAEIFGRLKSTRSWDSFVVKYPIVNKVYKEGLNQSLMNGLTNLVAMDQKDYVRQSKGEFERSKLNATTERVDDGFIKLIEKEGFPTEEKIGIKILEDTIISSSNDYYVLINHSHQVQSDRLPEVKEILTRSAEKFEYDMLRNNLSKLLNLGTCYMLYKGNLYIDKTCSEQSNILQKIKYSYQNKYGFIIDQEDLSAFGYDKETEVEDTKFMNEKFNFIMKLTDEMYLSN